MVLPTRVTGLMDSHRVKEHFSIKMATSMKESGATISALAMASISIKMEQPTSVIGKMTCSQDKVKKYGQRDQDTMAIMSKVRNSVTGFTHGLMAHYILGTGTRTK